MKLYVFLDKEENIIDQVRAENHDDAIDISGLPPETDFYSTDTQSIFEMDSEDIVEQSSYPYNNNKGPFAPF